MCMGQKGLGVANAITHCCRLNQITRIVVEIALLAQRVENNPNFFTNPHGQTQGLNHGLVVARCCRRWPVAVGHQSHHRALHDGFIGCVKPRFITQARYCAVGQISMGGGKQTLHLICCGGVALQLIDFDEVFPDSWLPHHPQLTSAPHLRHEAIRLQELVLELRS